MNKMLNNGSDSINFSGTVSQYTCAAAMVQGDEDFFEKKLS